jgi:hypothetical protein
VAKLVREMGGSAGRWVAKQGAGWLSRAMGGSIERCMDG